MEALGLEIEWDIISMSETFKLKQKLNQVMDGVNLGLVVWGKLFWRNGRIIATERLIQGRYVLEEFKKTYCV